MSDCCGPFVPASFTGDAGGGGLGVNVQDEGVPLAGNPHSTLNFIGGNITAVDAGGGVANVTVAVVAGININDEGVAIPGNPHVTLNFTGAGVVATDAGAGVANVTIPGGINVSEEGVAIAGNPHLAMNFVGAGVTATDVAGVATVTVPGGITMQEEGVGIAGNPHAVVNFVGAGVTASDVAGVGTVTVPGASVALGLQAFRYTVTGGEASLSDFFVPLPVARANDTYRVQGTLSGVAVIVGFDLPDLAAADRTTVQFRFVSSAPMTAGDQIDFLVTDVV